MFKIPEGGYKPGMILCWQGSDGDIEGKVLENTKLPGDVCVEWETGQFSSYDPEFLAENTVVLK